MNKEIKEIFEKYGLQIILENMLLWIDEEKEGSDYLNDIYYNIDELLTFYKNRYK